MVPGPGTDTFRGSWLLLALEAFLREHRSSRRVDVGFGVGGAFVAVGVGRAGTTIEYSPLRPPGTVLHCEPDILLGLASGMLSVEQAVAQGLLEGRIEDMRAVFIDSARPRLLDAKKVVDVH
jgi:hypothetical protein